MTVLASGTLPPYQQVERQSVDGRNFRGAGPLEGWDVIELTDGQAAAYGHSRGDLRTLDTEMTPREERFHRWVASMDPDIPKSPESTRYNLLVDRLGISIGDRALVEQCERELDDHPDLHRYRVVTPGEAGRQVLSLVNVQLVEAGQYVGGPARRGWTKFWDWFFGDTIGPRLLINVYNTDDQKDPAKLNPNKLTKVG